MNRRIPLQGLAAWAALPLLPACTREAVALVAPSRTVEALNHPDSYWRGKVSPAAFDVLFEADKEKRRGTFICAACYLPLFNSEDKFDSGTGWPSFTQPIPGHVGTQRDFLLVFPRTEYHCVRCGGHQGHIFNDGPPPLGKRWCNNGLALHFVVEGEAPPALRGQA